MTSGVTALQSKANPQQLEAILATDGSVLIIAGPCSGKTFTLVERIVYLITHKGVTPETLLVVTFTDKAARELTIQFNYPDFIFQREEPDGSLKYVIVEVKADNQIEDAVVQAKKDFAQQIAVASGMEYRTLKSSDADKRHFRVLL